MYVVHFYNLGARFQFPRKKKKARGSKNPNCNYEFGIFRMVENLLKNFPVIYRSIKLGMMFREIFTAKRTFLFFSIKLRVFVFPKFC